MNLRKWNSNTSELMKRIQTVKSSLQGNSIESPSTSAISEEEETYAKSTTNTQDCKEGESSCFETTWSSLEPSNWSVRIWFFWIHWVYTQPSSQPQISSESHSQDFWPFGFLSPFVIRLKGGHRFIKPIKLRLTNCMQLLKIFVVILPYNSIHNRL